MAEEFADYYADDVGLIVRNLFQKDFIQTFKGLSMGWSTYFSRIVKLSKNESMLFAKNRIQVYVINFR